MPTWRGANLLAATGMFAFLAHRHPSSLASLRRAWHE
jgi:hypothetical protein